MSVDRPRHGAMSIVTRPNGIKPRGEVARIISNHRGDGVVKRYGKTIHPSIYMCKIPKPLDWYSHCLMKM